MTDVWYELAGRSVIISLINNVCTTTGRRERAELLILGLPTLGAQSVPRLNCVRPSLQRSN